MALFTRRSVGRAKEPARIGDFVAIDATGQEYLG